MDDSTAAGSPLDTLTDTVGPAATQAFGVLGNETRLAILLALWDAKVPGGTARENALSFSDLRERVGIADSGQFNYHLNQLTETFVNDDETGYTLSTPGEQVLRAVFAGTLTPDASFEDEPVEGECIRCGAGVVIDYRDGLLTERCTQCDGAYQRPDEPRGLIARGYLPPAGLDNRSPQAFRKHGRVWTRLRMRSIMEGVCPDCTGKIDPRADICADHQAEEGTICDNCDSMFAARWLYVCETCKLDWWMPAFSAMMTELDVLVFFAEHGIDLEANYDEGRRTIVNEAIRDVQVTATDPEEILVTVEIDGDRLNVTLDDSANVARIDRSVA